METYIFGRYPKIHNQLFLGKYLVTQDGWVKIWKVKINQNKITSVVEQEAKSFGGPVYRANFNFLGNVIAISYCNEAE